MIHFFGEVPLGDFFAFEGKFAVLPLVTATLMVTVIALLLAVPLGLGAALYLSEYASRRVRKVLKPTVELLAGVPSVVYGFFALTFVTPTLLQDILDIGVGFTNALAAGLVLGVMIIPTIASLAEDAMSAVPQAMRQGSLAMGANRMQTTLRVVFPAALSGIAAAVVLGLSRAVGETMIVALAAWLAPIRLWPERALDWLDAAGLAAYAVYGAAKALQLGISPVRPPRRASSPPVSGA